MDFQIFSFERFSKQAYHRLSMLMELNLLLQTLAGQGAQHQQLWLQAGHVEAPHQQPRQAG